MTDTVFDGVQTWLTHPLSFLRLLFSSPSIPLRPSLYLYNLLTCRGCHPTFLCPHPPILSGLIVLHVFIQAFMAASSSRRPISPADDGFLPPVIAAIYYQRRSTSHFSDFGKMVFTLDRFTDSPYNISAERLTQTHARSHNEVTQSERKPHITIIHCRFTRR